MTPENKKAIAAIFMFSLFTFIVTATVYGSRSNALVFACIYVAGLPVGYFASKRYYMQHLKYWTLGNRYTCLAYALSSWLCVVVFYLLNLINTRLVMSFERRVKW